MITVKNFLLALIPLFPGLSRDQCLNFEIVQHEISLSSNSNLATVNILVKNCSERTIILYGIEGKLVRPLVNDSEYCEDDVSGGLVVHLFDEVLEPIFPEVPIIPEEIDYKPMPKEVLTERINSSGALFVKNTRVLAKGESTTLSKEVDLTGFQLSKGKYFIQVTYFIGKRLSNYVDSLQVEKDEIRYDAKIFTGCVKSHKVPILVK